MVPQHNASKVNGEHQIFRSKQALTSVKPIYSDAALSGYWIQDQRRIKDALCILCHCNFPSKRKTRRGELLLAWIYLLRLFPLGCFQMGSNMATVFWLFPHLLLRRLCIMLFSQRPWVPMSLIHMYIRSLSSIRYCLWGYTKHFSALSYFFWLVYNLLCFLPLSYCKWLDSGASGNRDLLYWYNRCSPAGSLWHRHIFCKVAGTMGDAGNRSFYMFQLLLPIFGCPVCRVIIVAGYWAQEWMQCNLQCVFELGMPWVLLSWLYSAWGQLVFIMWKHPRISNLNPYKSQDLGLIGSALFCLGLLSLRLKGPLKQNISISVLRWMVMYFHKTTATASDHQRLRLSGPAITLKMVWSFQHF